MRIAWLSPYLPAPETSGGRIRIARLAHGFPSAEMHLFSRLADDDVAVDAAEARDSLAPFASVVGFRPGKKRFRPLSVPQLIRQYPPGQIEALEEAHRKKAFDVVVIEHCYGRPRRMPALAGALRVLDEHNIESMYFRRATLARRPIGTRNVDSAIQYLQWRHFERMTWRESDVITTVSPDDCARVREDRPDTGDVVPNGVAIRRLRYLPPSGRTSKAVLFLGLMSYEPNIVAALRLANEIMPLVRREIPEAQLTLAGRGPSDAVRALASPNVRVTGMVDDLAHLFDEHTVFAMPLKLGAGSSLKALEALAAGLPLVASSFAVRGHQMVPGQHFLDADDTASIARQIVDVLRAPGAHDELASRGRALAEGSDWDAISRRFATLVTASRHARAEDAQRSSPAATA